MLGRVLIRNNVLTEISSLLPGEKVNEDVARRAWRRAPRQNSMRYHSVIPPSRMDDSALVESQVIKVSKPARGGSVRVTFALSASEPPGAVSVVGDFNNWDPFAHPLRKRSNGTRSTVVTVLPGSTLHFRYLAEGGMWFDDESVPAMDGQGATISV
jgi:hypothetical protein